MEKYPKAKAARSAANAQQMIGWKTFFRPDGNLRSPKKKGTIKIQEEEEETHKAFQRFKLKEKDF